MCPGGTKHWITYCQRALGVIRIKNNNPRGRTDSWYKWTTLTFFGPRNFRPGPLIDARDKGFQDPSAPGCSDVAETAVDPILSPYASLTF